MKDFYLLRVEQLTRQQHFILNEFFQEAQHQGLLELKDLMLELGMAQQ
jgi:hypothetical protein